MENYFTFFNIDQRLYIDQGELRKKYYAKSKNTHPDYFTELNLDESAKLNEAYRILSNDDLRLKHIIEIHFGQISEQSADLPSHFLMEMMELNEELDEQNSKEEISSKIHQVSDRELSTYQYIIECYESGDRSLNTLSGLKEYYYKKKYFSRLLSRINNEDVEI